MVEEMKQGNNEAFERCYRMLSPQVYTAILRICQNPATSQELLQDTFLDVFEKIHLYKKQHSFLAWVKRIAFNNTISFLKRNRRVTITEEPTEGSDLIEYDVSQAVQDSQLLESLLDKVSEVERLILWLFVVEQYNHEEVAVLFGKTPSYSKSIVSRALKKIRLHSEAKDYAYR